MKTPYDRLAKLDKNCSGHITKMATTTIDGKNLLNIFFGAKWPLVFVFSIADVGPTRFAQMMNLG